MRSGMQLEWTVLEAEAEEWAEVTMQAMSAERSPSHRQRWLSILGGILLIALLSSLVGHQLWCEAEAGNAATEGHIGALVEVEALRRSSSVPSGQIVAHARSVAVKGNAAMVSVVVTETSPSGHELPHVETRFYRRRPAGWQRTEPIIAFWGRKAKLKTDKLTFDYFELDRPFVERVAEPIDSFHYALRRLLGLPELTTSERITIVVAPNYVPPGETLPDGSIIEPSPILHFVAADEDKNGSLYEDADSSFYLRLRSQLIERSVMESRVVYGVTRERGSLPKQIESWLYDHAADLPSLVYGEPQRDEKISVVPAHAIEILTGDEVNTSRSLGNVEYATQSTTFSTHALFDFLVADRGPEAISALLAAMSTHENWPGVLDAAFGLSMDELQAEWEVYILAPRYSPRQ